MILLTISGLFGNHVNWEIMKFCENKAQLNNFLAFKHGSLTVIQGIISSSYISDIHKNRMTFPLLQLVTGVML